MLAWMLLLATLPNVQHSNYDARPAQTNVDGTGAIDRHDAIKVRTEDQVAESILQTRARLQQRAGGLGPGVHIVALPNAIAIDPKAVRTVSSGIIDFDRDLATDRNFNPANRYRTDRSIYIEPMNIDRTVLARSRFEGYYTSGKYLRGPGYAKSEKLRALKRTPSGRTGWTELIRYYSGHPRLGSIELREADNVAAGITVRVPRNSINARVGNGAATLIRLRDTNGKTTSRVRWFGANGRTNSLSIKQVDDASVAIMMRLADDLARQGG